MTAGGSPAGVTICQGKFLGLYADDYGLTVRNFLSDKRRFAWAEVSRFADGSYASDGERGWALFIVLRTGRRVRVDCTMMSMATPELLHAVSQVAERYDVPADLTGIPTHKDGRPARSGLYQDPGGQAGVRFWDGEQWSPLLPPDIGGSRPVQKSRGSWSGLPAADNARTYAAPHVRSSTVGVAVFAVVSAALLVWGFLGHAGVGQWVGIGGFSVAFALAANYFRQERKFFLKLGKAAKRAPRIWS